MIPIENVNLSFRCDKALNKMAPCATGLYCASCNKTLIDFRSQDLAALTKALEDKGAVCGIFSKSQMHTATSVGFFSRLITKVILTLGLGVFNKQMLAQTVPDDSLIHKNPQEEKGEFYFGTFVEIMPTFKDGGDKGLFQFLSKHIQYPADSVHGRVVVTFLVDTAGKTKEIRILKSLSKEADEEAIRVAKLLEFVPAMRNGKKVETAYNLPIIFSLDASKKKKK